MLDINLSSLARAAGASTLIGLVEKLGVKPPPPSISIRNLINTHTLCTFSFDSFTISNTRSRHNDTDFASFSLKIGANDFGTLTKSMGDLNNGTYQVGLDFPNIAIDGTDDSTPVLLIYQIVNAGNSGAGVNQRLTTDADVIAGAIAGGSLALAGPTSGVSVLGLIAAGAIEALANLYAWATVDCDGPVAAGVFRTTGQELFSLVSQAPLSHTDANPGIDSPAGCGSNSQYTVTWSAVKTLP